LAAVPHDELRGGTLPPANRSIIVEQEIAAMIKMAVATPGGKAPMRRVVFEGPAAMAK
jgi:hypothetical protein